MIASSKKEARKKKVKFTQQNNKDLSVGKTGFEKIDHPKETIPVELKPLIHKSKIVDGKSVSIELVNDPNIDMRSILSKSTGSKNETLGLRLLEQAIKASITSKIGSESMANSVSAAMLEVSPRDVFEGMLATQIISVHNHIMKLVEKACTAQNVYLSDNYLKITNKLMRTFVLQLDVFNKYRNGGKQRIIVKRVNVKRGGKAIVGNVHQGGKGGS